MLTFLAVEAHNFLEPQGGFIFIMKRIISLPIGGLFSLPARELTRPWPASDQANYGSEGGARMSKSENGYPESVWIFGPRKWISRIRLDFWPPKMDIQNLSGFLAPKNGYPESVWLFGPRKWISRKLTLETHINYNKNKT